ncbi:hypothetical protein [Escherichia coli]|uniref:hypothetical protein n=1 Tax=Escherichia coli TaxID=562 RepID=UPI002687718D
MKIKHEHIRMAMNVWAHPDGEKVPAAKITKAYFELGMTFPELYDDSHPEALARNTLGASGRRKSAGCENYQSVFRAGNDVPGTV